MGAALQDFRGYRGHSAPPAGPIAAACMRLEASDLACVRGGREVFAGLAVLPSAAGEALLVTGRNGAGKSSLLRMIAGLVRVGRRTAGADRRRPRAAAPRAGALPRPPGRAEAVADASAENLEFWARYLGGGEAGCRAALAAVGLDSAGRAARRLSLRRPAAAAVDRAAARGQAADLAARRADLRARPRGAGRARRADARASRRRRADRRRGARADRRSEARAARLQLREAGTAG